MNSILTGNSNDIKTAKTTGQNKDTETTGSLASAEQSPIFSLPVCNYDMFIPTNPFSLNIDYGSYAEAEGGTLANNSTFMQGFANAMSILSDNGFGSFGGAEIASASSSGFSAGSCSIGGGFTSVG